MNPHTVIALLVTGLLTAGSAPGAATDSASIRAERCAQPGPYALPQAAESVDLDPADGEAEDRAKVLSTSEVLRTRFGLRKHVLQTANTTPLQPDILENKFYVRGIGPVLELNVSPDLGTAVLVRMDRPAE